MKISKTKELFDYDVACGMVVAGCDEAGRGPLAGPVVCAACIMPMDQMIDGINDSKKVSEAKRESLFEIIKSRALAYHIAIVDSETIDKINILQATKLGMSEAINAVAAQADIAFVDAVKDLKVDIDTKAIIKGDATSYNIAAASILAKVARDRLMREYDEQYPEYGFVRNKGYGTREHIAALAAYGLTPIHRRSFVSHFEVKNG